MPLGSVSPLRPRPECRDHRPAGDHGGSRGRSRARSAGIMVQFMIMEYRAGDCPLRREHSGSGIAGSGLRSASASLAAASTEVESFRALARYAPDAVTRLHSVLDQIDLIDLSPQVRILAQTVRPVAVRFLDAIHLGAALSIRRSLTSFVTYDKRLLDAAKGAGLPADSPT
jgi:predicted nucleic acid-binding protein